MALVALPSSDALWRDRVRGMQVKLPIDCVGGMLRLFERDYGDTAQCMPMPNALGERLFTPPSVKRGPGGAPWTNSATLLARKQFVERMYRSTAAGYHARRRVPDADPGADVEPVASLANGALRFDLDGWLARFGATPQFSRGGPRRSAELQRQHAIPPIPPVEAIEADANSAAYLRAWLTDPVRPLRRVEWDKLRTRKPVTRMAR